MIRIAITPAAFEAIAATLPLGSVGYEREPDEKGERLIWLDPAVVNRLRTLRAPGESYSDVILRVVDAEGRLPKTLEVHMHNEVKFDVKEKSRHRSPAGKNTFNVEITEGNDLHRNTGKWNKLWRRVDREGNKYQERIIDGETGEIIRDVNEPLGQHKGPRSPRKK